MTEKTLNIHQRINKVMQECPYLQKEKAQQGQGIKYDTVIATLRGLLIKYGIVVVVRQIDMICLGGVEGTKQKVYQGQYEMDLINMDEPTDIVTHSAYAHGMDGGDKAPGKAHTYAVKIMLVKGFFMDTGENEESRAEDYATITLTQVTVIKKLTDFVGDDVRDRMLASLSIDSIEDMPKSQFTKMLKGLQSQKKLMEQTNDKNTSVVTK